MQSLRAGSTKDFSRRWWLAAFAVVATTAAILVVVAWQSYREVDDDARSRMAAKAQLVAARFASVVRDVDTSLDDVLQDAGKPAVCDRRQIGFLARRHPEYRAITVMDDRGIIRCSSLEELSGRDRSAEDYTRKAIANPSPGVLTIQPPLVSKLSGVPILVLHKAAVDRAGKLRAMAQVSFDLRQIDDMLEALREGGQTVSLTHDSGMIVARVPDAQIFRLRNIAKDPESAFSRHRTDHKPLSTWKVVAATDGIERLVAFADVMPKTLALAPRGYLLAGVSEPVDAVFAGWRRQTGMMIAAWLLLTGGIILLTVRVVRGKRRLLLEIAHQQRMVTELRGMSDMLTQQRDALDEHAIVSMTDTRGRIVYVNDKFCEISGYSEKELLGQDHRIVNSGTHPPEFFRNLWRTIAAGFPWHGLICNRGKDGFLYWVRSTIMPMRNGKGQVDAYMSIRTDVTELVEAEKSLARSERALRVAKEEAELARDAAEDANRQKSTFLASMSHELRTPMNSILGFTQLLQMEQLDAGIKEDIAHIHKAGKHLLTLINEVLDLSRIESGQIELSLETFDIGQMQSEVLDTITPLAQRKGIALTCRLPAEPLLIKADRNRMHQVVLNLISNAIKYNRPRGRVEVGAERRGDRVRIAIADTGIGLSEADRKKLFTPYTRFGPRHIEGTGIGLTITKRLVEAMGGVIGVDSELDVGSTFWVEFPQVAAGTDGLTVIAGGAEDSPQEDASRLRGTVLYIEDNKPNQAVVTKALRSFPDIELLVEADPLDGLATAVKHKPGLILLDINLPQIDGFEVIARLRADLLTRDIPVVAVSASALRVDVDRAMAAGFDGYLAKPVDVFSLRRVVRQYLQPKAA